MRVGCAQLAYRSLDVASGRPRIESNLSYLSSYYSGQDAVDVLVLGEFWLTSPNGSADYEASAVGLDEVGYLLGEFAREHAVHVLACFIERHSDDVFYNTSVLVDGDGRRRCVYREVAAGLMAKSILASPFDTGAHASSLSEMMPVVDTDFGRIGVAVGSDLTYPELFNSMFLDGVEIVLHSAHEPIWASGPYQQLKAARCIEGGFFLASCNVADSPDVADGKGESFGGSQILGPDGNRLAEANTNGECFIVSEIDRAQSEEARSSARLRRRRSAPWLAGCAQTFHTVHERTAGPS